MGIEFAKKGADVVLVARDVEKLKLAVNKVEVAVSMARVLMYAGCKSIARAENQFSERGSDCCRGGSEGVHVM